LTANGNWAGSFLSHPYDNDNTDNSFRVNNSIKYVSTNYAGFSFEGMYGLSNQAGGFANNRLYSLAAQYTGGALTVVGAYLQVNNPGATQVGAVATDDANFFAARTQVYGVGINYSVTQAATLGFVYTRSNNREVISSAYVGKLTNPASSLDFDNYEISGKYQFTSNFYTGLMVSYTVGHFESNAGNSRPKWGEIGGMADYNLSKRSDVYVQAAWQHATGGGAVSAPFNTAFIVGADGASSTSNQVVARVSFRHTF
jgi:predicted porin